MTKEQYFDYLGITKFWQAGYTGQNVRIMSDELIEENYSNTSRWREVICPKGYKQDASHGSSVMLIMQEICPDATYYAYPFTTSNGCSKYIQENGINLFTCSNIAPSTNKAKDKQMQECIDAGCTFFIAAGNTSEKGVYGEAKSDKWLAIGVADIVNKKIVRVEPSAIGEELDYCMLPPFGRWTSWCSPTFTAMCGLVQDFFISNTGKALNREQLIKFIDDNIIDIEEAGFDTKSGKGLFILPEPSTIDIYKYIGGGQLQISQIGLSLIKKWEGCRLTAYQDAVGVWTIGYGTTNADTSITGLTVKSGVKITQQQADDFLLKSIQKKYIPRVEKYDHIYHWNQNQIDALTSFAYNIGSIDQLTGNGTRSIASISQHMLAYNTAGGQVLQGLTNRRKEEKVLFDKGVVIVEEPKVSDWAKTAWEWCKSKGYLDGTNPQGVVTREMMAQILYNLYNK